MSFVAIYITHPDEGCARRVCDELLRRKLVACANIFPITSAYWWEGAVAREGEVVSLVKTLPRLWPGVAAAVEALHPYEVPCIMKFEVEANPAYEQWIAESVGGG